MLAHASECFGTAFDSTQMIWGDYGIRGEMISRRKTTYDVNKNGDENGARDLASDLGIRVLGAAEELVVPVAEEGADDGEDEDRKGRDDHAIFVFL
jgi:hypothetical protein